MQTQTFRTVIIGAGPAGIGPIVCALQKAKLDEFLAGGVALLDAEDRIGRGAIGQYVINSDTLSNTFLECLQNQQKGPLAALLVSPSTLAIQRFVGGPAPLKVVGDFMADLGEALRQVLDAHPVSRWMPRTVAHSVHMNADGMLTTHATVVSADGSSTLVTLVSQHVIVATGGAQSWHRVVHECVAGVPLAPDYESKIMLTSQLLSHGGPEEAERRIRASGKRNVVIVGGSHSAFSSAWVLLNKTRLEFGDGDMTVLHREKLKLFYPTKEAAWAEGYTDFNDDDICPLTQRVYRLGGFRFDSRELLMRIWGVNGRALEKRVHLARLQPDQRDGAMVKALLDDAALVVPAFGYRPVAMDVRDANGDPIELLCHGAGAPPMVDNLCRVLDAHGKPIDNMFGIGLASGFVPSGKLGGEPSFRGQTNGLWLYQNGVGEIILDQIM